MIYCPWLFAHYLQSSPNLAKSIILLCLILYSKLLVFCCKNINTHSIWDICGCYTLFNDLLTISDGGLFLMFTFLDGFLPAPNNRLYGFYNWQGCSYRSPFHFFKWLKLFTDHWDWSIRLSGKECMPAIGPMILLLILSCFLNSAKETFGRVIAAVMRRRPPTKITPTIVNPTFQARFTLCARVAVTFTNITWCKAKTKEASDLS